MTTPVQRSFTGGEVAPSLYARADTSKYQAGLRACRNFLVMRHGGAQNRPGSGFSGEVKDSSKTVRLARFVFNNDQTYVLEFGDLYMRVIRDGEYVTEASQAITGITNANPAVLTYTGADNFANGNEVYISGVVGAIAPYVNGRTFKVVGVDTGANTFQLDYMDGTNVNSTTWGAYTSGGTIEEIYTITTPYVEADLSTLHLDTQSADVITITHPNYAPRELARSGHATWTLTAITFAPATARPTGTTYVLGGAGALTIRYKVTAIDTETREESLAGKSGASNSITAVTQANPASVTYSGADNYTNGTAITIEGVVGMTQLNGKDFVVANVNTGANTFQLQGINSTGYTAYSSGGTVYQASVEAVLAAAGTVGAPLALSWTAVAGAVEYNIYKEINGVYGYIGTAGIASFNDTGIEPDTEETPPIERNPFDSTGNYPSTSTYYQQRRLFANTDNDPEKVWATKSGQFTNLTTSSPLQDDDAVTFTLAGRQVNEVMHLIDIGKLITMTSSGEIAIEGDASGILRPGEVNPKPNSYYGSSRLPPLIIGNNALYVQARGSIVRDLGFDYQVDGYRGSDLTVFSAHMFEGFTIADWAYQQNPHSIVWLVRSDGQLLGLTYVREHQVLAWHRHDFGGTVENVCVVPEGEEDSLYFVIKRTVNGKVVRYIERMKTRVVDEDAVEDAVFVDSSLSYDGTNAGATTMTLSGSGWTYQDTLTMTASAAFFTSADVGNAIHLKYTNTDGDADVIRCTITAYTSTTVVSVLPHKTVPAAQRAAAILTWGKAVDELTGLWHLEGEDVSIFADGFVVANPNNDAYDVRTVTNGTVTLDRPYSVIHVGLPYTSDLETLDLDTVQGETLMDKKKLITKVTLSVEKSRGIWVGGEAPDNDTVAEATGLRELKLRDEEGYDDPNALQTGNVDVTIEAGWNQNGRVFIRQTDPIPLAVLAIAPTGLIPYKG